MYRLFLGRQQTSHVRGWGTTSHRDVLNVGYIRNAVGTNAANYLL
nr:MAG TPA: hypothetical protein [Caudoviricetes sp.]